MLPPLLEGARVCMAAVVVAVVAAVVAAAAAAVAAGRTKFPVAAEAAQQK